MSPTDQTYTYTGFWIDWTDGRLQGATLTLSHRNGALLQSFTAVFTTIVFAQLWSIVALVLHHARSTRNHEDGLEHQQQAVLRNSSSLATAIILARQIFYWRGKAENVFVRCLGWASLALCFAVAGGLASTFSGYAASKSSLNRLIIGNNCGYTTYGDQTGDVNSWAYTLGMAKGAVAAANYARSCYDDDDDGTGGLEQCRRYVRPRLNWTASYNTPCPFESGICSDGDSASFTLITDKIDSLTELGINSPLSERLTLQKKTICSSIREINNYNQDGDLLYYNFGPINGFSNYTFVYNRLAEDALVSYSLATTYSYAGFASAWSPIQALNRTNADVTIIFISSNTVVYEYPNNDPVFSATTPSDFSYSADYAVSSVACAEQYQICNPTTINSSGDNETSCSPWMGAAQVSFQADYLQPTSNTTRSYSTANLWAPNQARLTLRQLAILERIAFVLSLTSTYNAIATRRASALRLQDTLSAFLQTQALPDNYWTFEIGWWFEACLARLQEEILDFAIGSPITAAGFNSSSYLPADEITRSMCKNQLTRDTGSGTINFSVLALCIIYILGLTIISLSLLMDQFSRIFYAKLMPRGLFKIKVWDEDAFLRTHARAFSAASRSDGGEDSNADEGRAETMWTSGSIPATTQKGKMMHFSLTPSTSYIELPKRDTEDASGKPMGQVTVDST